MTTIILNLLKSLLVESVIRRVAIAALKTGVKMARLGANSTSNKLDDAGVDLLESAANAAIDVWNGKSK